MYSVQNIAIVYTMREILPFFTFFAGAFNQVADFKIESEIRQFIYWQVFHNCIKNITVYYIKQGIQSNSKRLNQPPGNYLTQ